MSAALSDSRTNGRHRVEVRLVQVHPIQPDARKCDRLRTFTLHDQHTSVILGRASKNRSLIPSKSNLWVESPIITKEHARFIRGPSLQQPLLVRDLNSTHGTYVAGVRVSTDYPVCEGDLVQFGDYISNGPLHFEPPTFLVEYTVRPVSAPPTPISSSPESSNMYSFHRRSDQISNSEVQDVSAGSRIRELIANASTFAVPDSSGSDSEYDSSHQSSELVEETDCPDSDAENDDKDVMFSQRSEVEDNFIDPHPFDRPTSSLNVEQGDRSEDGSRQYDEPEAAVYEISDDDDDDEEEYAAREEQDHALDGDNIYSLGYESDNGSVSDVSDVSRASLPPTQPSPPRERQFLIFDVNSPGSVEISDESDEDVVSRESVFPATAQDIKSAPLQSRSASPNRDNPWLSIPRPQMSIHSLLTVPDSPIISTNPQQASVQDQHGASRKDPIILDGVAGLLDHGKTLLESDYRPRSPDLRHSSVANEQMPNNVYYDGPEDSLRISRPLDETLGRQPSPSDAAMAKPQYTSEPSWKTFINPPRKCGNPKEGCSPAYPLENPSSGRNVYHDGPFQRPRNAEPAQPPYVEPAKSDHRLRIQELINQSNASSPPRKRDAFEAGLDDETFEAEDFGSRRGRRGSDPFDRDELDVDVDEDFDMDFDPTMDRSVLIEQRTGAAPEVILPTSEDIESPVTRKPYLSEHYQALAAKANGSPVADDRQEAGEESVLDSQAGGQDTQAIDEDDTTVLTSLPTAVEAYPTKDARPTKRVKIQVATEPTPRPRFKHLMSKAVPFMAGAAATAATIFAGATMLISTMHEELRQEALLDLGL